MSYKDMVKSYGCSRTLNCSPVSDPFPSCVNDRLLNKIQLPEDVCVACVSMSFIYPADDISARGAGVKLIATGMVPSVA